MWVLEFKVDLCTWLALPRFDNPSNADMYEEVKNGIRINVDEGFIVPSICIGWFAEIS